MSNIFQERDESKLIKDRKVQPVKGNPVQQPAPPQQEQPPEPTKPDKASQPSNSPVTPQQPQAEVTPQPEAPQPVDYSQYYSAPIPFMPPVGYAGVQSNPNAFQAQYQLLDALQTPEVQQGRLDPIIPLLQQNVVTNPGVTSLADVSDDLNEKAERWTNDWTSSVNKSHQSYKNYVTHNNVGVNPATQFDPSGKPIRRATETEIRTGLNGLMSELGTSLRNNFDKDNWFTGSIQTMKGLVPMVGSVLKSIPGIGGFVQVADILTEKFLGEDAVKSADPMVGDAKRAMYQLAHGNVGEANKILQNSPVQTNWDYGKGLTGLAFYALSLPENLVAAGVYEYADGWRQFMDNRDKRGFTQNFTAGLQAAAGTIGMFEPELDKTNRFGQVLRGKSLGTFQRWTEDKYLSMQEPAGVEMGTIINNPYFDLPENLIKAYNLLPTPDIDTTKGAGFWTQAMLHNVTQGIPAFMIEMLADAPADFLVGSLWKAGKALDGIDLLPNRVSGLVEAGEDVPFIQTRPVGQLALPGTVEVPGVDEYRASIMTVDVEARTVGDYPMVADPWDVSPNPNKAQTTIINLDSEVPRIVPSVDLDYVRRSNEDLARLANRMGILVEPTPEGIDALMRQDPQQFARYGKPVHPEIENFNGVQVNGEVVPVANVYPISLTPPDAPPSLEDLTAAGNLMSDAAEDIKDALRTGNDPSSALVLYKQAESDFVVARDGLPPEAAYKENVHNLPNELVTQKPEALEAGINYVSNLVEAEQTNRVVKQLVNEYEQLDGVEQLIDTKLKALPDVGYEDMHDVQAVMGQNGMDDMMNNPIAKDVPEPQDLLSKTQNDPLLLEYEQQVKDAQAVWAVKSDELVKKITKEYKKQGLDPLDYDTDPEFALPQAEHLFNMQELLYKQMKRQAEIGKLDPMSADNFLTAQDAVKANTTILPKAKKDSLQFMYDDIQSMLSAKKASKLKGSIDLNADPELQKYQDVLDNQNSTLAEVESAWSEVGDMPASPEVRNLSKALEEKYNKLAEGADLRSDYTEANRSWATDAVSGAEDEQGVEEIISEMQKYYKLTDADVSELRAVKAEQTTKTAETQAVSNLDLQGTLDNINTQRSKVIAERESLGVATGKQKAKAEELDTARDWLERIQDHVASRPSLAETMLPSINQAVDDLDIDLMNDIWTKLSSSPREAKGFSVTRAATQESVPKQVEVEQTKPMFADAFGNEMTPLQKYTDSSAKFYDNPEWQEPLQEYLQKFPVESAPEAVRVLPKPASDALKKRINSGNLGVGDILPRSNNVQSWGVTDPAFSWSALDLPNRVKLFAKDLPSIRVPDSESALKNKKEFITLPDLELRITKIEKVDDGSIHVTVEPVRKVNPVPQQQVIEQQIQTTDKAGDLQMSGGGGLNDAWQAGVDWFKDAYSDMVDALSVKVELVPTGTQPTTWLHGTNVNDDVRRFMPENGSGTHELGIGLYLTDSDQVAEAAAKKFRYENTPVNMNYEVGDATIRELSDINIENTLDLNMKIGKKQFMEIFQDALTVSPADAQDFYKYWKSNTDNSIGSVFDSYREWYSNRWGIDELVIRQFQVDVFNSFKLDYDAGVHTAPNGVRTMVVYNPDKLTNSGVRFVDRAAGADETLEALEARRFLDHQAEVAMGSDTRKVVRLQSESDLTTYQKQKASEALAEELAKQAEATKNITEADEVLRETVRKAEDEKINKVEEAVEKGDADSVPVESPKHKVSEVLGSRNSYHKFRDKLGQKLDKKLKRLDKLTGNTKVKQKLIQEIDELVKQLDNVDTYVYHQQRIFEAVQHEPVRGDWKDLLSTILHQVDGHIIDPDWWKHRGNYKWDKAFQQASEGFNSIIAKFVSNYLGGDIGKVQRELHNLKRVGRGDFALRLAQREASQRVARVQKEVKQMLKQFNLSEHDFGRLFHDVAELQTSKYIMDEAFADSKVAHYLSNKLNTQFSYFINEMGIPLDVMEDVALKVQEIPQVYKEVKQLANELGINFGDEVSLGYIPRQTKKTTEFWMKDATQADFTKSRQAFHWIPEDSKVVEAVLDAHSKHWKKRMSENLGREIKHFDDLLDSDSTILQAVIGYMNDDVIDFLNDMGIMRKIPFTASESAEFIAKKYDLPFKGIADVYITDPKRAMEMYTRGLTNKAGRNMTAFGFTEMPAFTKNIEDMTDAEKEVFTVPFMEALPDALKGSLPDDFTKLVEPLYVHPLVARELEAMYHTSTSAGILAQIGDTLSLIYKYQSSQMLASGGWLAYQEIGNSMNLVKRNINPASFFDFQAKRVHAAATGKQVTDLMDDTKKVYGNGAFTQKEVAQQALRFGIIDSDATFLGSSSPRPSVFNYSDPSTWGNAPKEIQRSLSEFIAFTFRLKGHQEDFPSAGGYFGGLVERLQSGIDTVIDHTTMKYVDTFNKLTDDGYKFALFEAVLRDDTLPIPGLRFASGIPHFTGEDAFRQAAEYVRDNAFMFDETSGAAGEQAMRYVIPFWSFHRLNIGETARWVASNPFKFGNWLRLANSLQADFEEGDSAQWEALQSNKWFDNNFTIPIRIKADRSQSGTDEVWTLPGAQIFPSAGALQATDSIRELVSNIPGVNIPKFKFDYGEGELRPSQSDVNPMSKGNATFIQREGSPFLKTLLGFLDENYLFDYDLSAGYEMDKDYALGMDKKQYALFKLWLRPMANLLNAMPTQLMGRAPSLNRATGEYKEGERSVFTGQYPHWTSANTPNFFGEGVFSDFLKNMKLQPMPFDTYINQEYTIGNITNQVYQAKDMMEKVRKELATTKPDDTAKIERLQQRAQETTLLYVHLQSEYEIYRQWRKLNNIPHPKAVKRIMQENLKVSDLLPEQERERIYKANWDKYMNYFTY